MLGHVSNRPCGDDLHRLIDSHQLIGIVPVVEDIVYKLLPCAAGDDGALIGGVPSHVPTRQQVKLLTPAFHTHNTPHIHLSLVDWLADWQTYLLAD